VFSARQLCSFSLWEQPTHTACFIFLVYRNNCETRHPRGSHPTASTTRPFVKVCSLAKSQKRLLLAQRRYIAFSSKDRSSRKKKGRRNVGPSLWNYVTVNWANTTDALWPAGPSLRFACATGPLQHGLNIKLQTTKVTPIWTRHLTRRSSRDVERTDVTWKDRNSIVCVSRARMHKER